MDLPAIEEAADKENDTFAVGGPLAGLARKVPLQPKRDNSRSSRSRSGVRSASSAQKPPLGLHSNGAPKSVDINLK
jgi:hypothetical protein